MRHVANLFDRITVQLGKQRFNAHNKCGETGIRIFLASKQSMKVFFNSLSEKAGIVVRLMQLKGFDLSGFQSAYCFVTVGSVL